MGLIDGFETKPGTGWQAAIQAAPAVLAGVQASQANRAYGERMQEIEDFRRQGLENPFANMSNPYENLAVATKAAEIQMEQSDQALATTLDTLRATGASAGGATALANAALKSKQGISASIEKQEINNQKLQAQGQLQVDIAKGKGEIKRMEMQEAREVSQLDRLQSQADLLRGQQLESQSAMISGIGGMGKAFTAGMVSQDRENPNDGNSYVNESGININDPKYNINNNDDMSFDNITLNDDDDPSQVNELDTKEFQNPLNNLNVNNSLAAGVTNNNNGYVPIIDLDEASQID